MAKKKKEEMADEVEEIVIEEDELPGDDGKSWSEEFKMAGNQVADFLKGIVHETNVRRVMVKNKDGKVLLDVPLVFGIVSFIPPILAYSVVALGIAVLTECSVTIERTEEPAAKEAAA